MPLPSEPRALAAMCALVTGAGRGIGRAIAHAFAAQGARVSVFARTARELAETVKSIEDDGGTARAFPLDVTDANAVRDAVAAIERSHGPVDVLVNNAAIIGPLGPFWESDPDEWWRAMEVNMRGPVLCSRAVLPAMIAHRRGRVINIVTGMAPMTYFSAYLASKTALVRFTECLALETKPFGVAAFSMAPGTVRTAMADHALTSPEGRKWLPWFRRIFDEGLDVPPERAAQLAVTLASGKADALSGRYLVPTDDLDLLLANTAEIERDHLYSLRVRGHPRAAAQSGIAAIRRAAAAPVETGVTPPTSTPGA